MSEFWNDTILNAQLKTMAKIDRAKKVNLSKVNFENKTAFIEEKDYNISLDHCTCYDFEANLIPCKHMYKLAIDLELMPDYVDLSLVKFKKDIPLLINSLTGAESEKLLDILSIFYNQDKPQPIFLPSDDLSVCGLILKKAILPLDVKHSSMSNWFLIVPNEKSIKIIPDIITALKI